MVTAFRTAFALLAAVAAGTAAAADWPRWRGPNGAGTAEGTLPDKPDLLWKAELPGTGAGFPIIVGGKVFLQTASADGTTRALVCLTATDGKTAWATAHDARKAASHPKSGQVASTPAADGAAIYCVWWDGPLRDRPGAEAHRGGAAEDARGRELLPPHRGAAGPGRG